MPVPFRRLSLLVLVALLATLLPPTRMARAATFSVTTNADSGAGSLRQAIIDANNNPGPDTIVFSGPLRIRPLSPLPELDRGDTTIDAGTAHNVILDGSEPALGTSNGLRITSANNEIRGLVIVGFRRGASAALSGVGIFLAGTNATGNKIYNCYIGTENGVDAVANEGYGVLLESGANNNDIGGTGPNQGNVISGNILAGVGLAGGEIGTSLITNNRIAGNRIGTDANGTARINGQNTSSLLAGISIENYARNNIIGPGNLIGGVADPGNSRPIPGIILLSNITSPGVPQIPRGNRIIGNDIGVNAAGTAIPNGLGILFKGGATYGAIDTTVGGTTDPATERNYIAGNVNWGIWIEDNIAPTTTGDTTITGNWIGVARNGGLAPNGSEGIFIGTNGAGPKTTVGPGNVISANKRSGIRIRSGSNIVKGNFIGVSPDGSQSSPSDASTAGFTNAGANVFIEGGTNNLIGGPTAADRNVIAYGGLSFGEFSGVLIRSLTIATSNNTVQGNYIGVNAAGTGSLIALGSVNTSSIGVQIDGSANNTVLNNVIAGNGRGLLLLKSQGTGETNTNTIRGNFIGTNATGATDSGNALPNRAEGIRILNGTGNTIVGNTIANNSTPDQGLNGFAGLRIQAAGNTVDSNRVVNNGRSQVSSSRRGGVLVDGATGVRITRSETTQNALDGIQLLSNGNNNLAAPTGLAVSGTTNPVLTGTACAGCEIEVFTSSTREDGEGPFYLTSGTADGSGAFSIPINGCLAYLTATARDGANNTSTFTNPMIGPIAVCIEPSFTLGNASPSAQSAAPGDQVVYSHLLTNQDAVARTFRVSWTSSAGWAAVPNFVDVSLGPNGSITIPVTVTVPLNASAGQSDSTTVSATTLGKTVTATQANITTVSIPVPNPSISTAADQSIPPSPAPAPVVFNYTVTNIGQGTGNFSIAASYNGAAPPGWSAISVNPPTLALTAGQSAPVSVSLTPPPNATAGAVSFTVVVTTQGNSNIAQTQNSVTVQFVPGLQFGPATQPTVSSAPGVPVNFTHTITNTGNGPDTFTIVAVTLPPTTPGLSAWSIAPVTLPAFAPGEVRQVTVQVNIPAGQIAGNYSVVLRAQRTQEPQPTLPPDQTDTIIVTAAAAPLISAGTQSPAGSVDVRAGPQSVTFSHSVTNVGNAAGNFAISVASVPAGWSPPTISNNTCTAPAALVPQNGTCSFDVQVTVPQGLDAGPYTVRVQAVAQDSTQATDTEDDVVTVGAFPGVELAPNRVGSGDPGQVVLYTHTLTNTGNTIDSYDITFNLNGPVGWSAIVTPTQILNVPRNGTATVEVAVRVPRRVLADPANDALVTVTARSRTQTNVEASATSRTSINAVDGADISPGTTKNANPTATESSTITFTHTVTNTGSTVLNYTLAVTNSIASWPAPTVTPASGTLNPGETQNVTISVTAPAGSANNIQNITRIRVLSATSVELAAAQNITRVGPRFGIFLVPKVNTGTLLPGGTRIYTHTLTNIGTNPDSFILATTASLGWETSVAPGLVDLGPGASTLISVTVRAPASVLSGTLDIAVLQVRSVSDPQLSETGEEQTTILQVPGVSISPSRFIAITPRSGELTLDFDIRNTGNGLDTLDVTLANTLNWTNSVVPTSQALGPEIYYPIQAKIRVPTDIQPGTFNTLTVRVASRRDPSITEAVQVVLSYPEVRVEPEPPPAAKLYLPIVRR